MATRQSTATTTPKDPRDVLTAKWRKRARVDAPIAFRAMMRAVNSAGPGGPTGPDQRCAGVILGGMISGDFAEVLPFLARVMETANHDEWWPDDRPGPHMDIYVNVYGADFVEAFGDAASEFGSSPRTVDDLLAEGRIADERRWTDALTTIWVDTIEPAIRASDARPDQRSGTTFVIYQYCVSLGIVSFKRSSGVKAIPPGGSRLLAGLPYSLVSLLFGWWGIPWGPFWTLQTMGRNFAGGIDVTHAVAGAMVPA